MPARSAVFAAALAFLAALLLAAPPAPAQPFTRITVGPPVENQAKSLSGGWADYDGDGDVDLLATDIGAANLYRNDGGDTFVLVPGAPSDTTADLANTTPAWADWDNDGDLDVYRCVFTRDSLGTATEPLPNRLYRNDGGAFTEIATSDDSTYCPAACWVDYDLDGDVDLFAAGSIGSPDLLYRNDDGALVKHTAPAFLGTFPGGVLPTWIDYDGDGDADLYMVNHGGQNEMWRNLLVETGVVDSFATDAVSGLTDEGSIIDFGASWGDYDNDGDLDVFLATAGVDHLYRNDGGGVFVRVLGIPLVQIARASSCGSWGDYDNDGDVDLFVPHAASTAQVPDLWRNDGGTFVLALAGDVGEVLNSLPGPQAAEWCDYDRDGDLDLYVVDWLPNQPGGAPRLNRLYRNDAAGNHWLHVDLEGTASNRSAIGAIVRVKAAIAGQPTWQMREVAGGPTAFEFQRELVTHFGLGDAATVDSLVIEWPSGMVETFAGVAADQVLHVVEAVPVDVPVAPSVAGASRAGVRFLRPNPFRADVTIGFALPRASRVEVAVYDGAGRLVRRLLDGSRPAGDGAVSWDGRDEARHPVGPGVYFVRLATPDGEWSGKALRLR